MDKKKKEKITRGILIGLLCLLCAGFVVGAALVISAYTGDCEGKESSSKTEKEYEDDGEWTPNY